MANVGCYNLKKGIGREKKEKVLTNAAAIQSLREKLQASVSVESLAVLCISVSNP